MRMRAITGMMYSFVGRTRSAEWCVCACVARQARQWMGIEFDSCAEMDRLQSWTDILGRIFASLVLYTI